MQTSCSPHHRRRSAAPKTTFVLVAVIASLAAGHRTSRAANVVVWDTGTRLSGSLENLDRSGWKVVPSDLLALETDPAKASSDPGYYGRDYSFEGDAVIENRSLTAVFASALGRVAVFSKSEPASGTAAHPFDGPPGKRVIDCAPLTTGNGAGAIIRLELVRNAADEAAIAVSYGAPGASAVFVLGKDGIVEIRIPEGVRGFRFSGPFEYGIVPGFIGDDLIYNPRKYPEAPMLSVPAENMLVGLLGDGDRELVVTWPGAAQPTRFQLGNDASGRRVIRSIDIEAAGSSVYLGFLAAPGLWHRRELRPTDLETDVSLSWKRPFPARWKTQLYEGDIKTTFHFREGRGQIWRGVPGSYSYPAWFEGESAFLRPSKKVPPKEECLVYFLEGQDTPLDRPTPVDILKATLGRAAADERLDLEGRKLRTHHRRGGQGVRRACTCGCTDAIQAMFEAGREVEQKDDIRDALDDMIYFVARHLERIEEYRRFADELIRFLRQSGTSSPGLAPVTDHLAEIAGLIPQECTLQAENMKSLQHADDLARQTLDLTARKAPDNLKAYMELLKAWRDMGGSQDYVVAHCHVVARRLFQEAGYGGVGGAGETQLGEEVRKRCRQVLRNPDGYEIWAEY